MRGQQGALGGSDGLAEAGGAGQELDVNRLDEVFGASNALNTLISKIADRPAAPPLGILKPDPIRGLRRGRVPVPLGYPDLLFGLIDEVGGHDLHPILIEDVLDVGV